MWQSIKYRYLSSISDLPVLIGTLALFITVNYLVLGQSGLLQPGHMAQFNAKLRYIMLVDSFVVGCQTWGLLIPILLGSRMLVEDISRGQLYVVLTGNPNRVKYLVGNWAGLLLACCTILLLLLANLLLIAHVLSITIIHTDLWPVMFTILTNMILLTTVTACCSVIGSGVAIAVGLSQVLVFNLHAFQTIPLMVGRVRLDPFTRRVLQALGPLEPVNPGSITSNAIQRLSTAPATPILFSSITQAATVHTVVFMLIAVVVFWRRDL